MSKQPSGTSDLQAIRRKRDMRRKTIPALAQAGPVSIWMILFVTLPMLFIIYISFMSRGVFGDVVYQFSLESYQTLLDATYFKVILKSLKAALLTTVLCLGLGATFLYGPAQQLYQDIRERDRLARKGRAAHRAALRRRHLSCYRERRLPHRQPRHI